jgi:hypothetical protein
MLLRLQGEKRLLLNLSPDVALHRLNVDFYNQYGCLNYFRHLGTFLLSRQMPILPTVFLTPF